ncbi:zinc-dependent metalloprotease [Psychrosphaera sp. G1-22]|uniref:Zinc-dependent metalloprotease n=1 Tax=Psychrosphaera algicola TaxID=3023714 RepID=A0ABT5FH48_9GAMM|nr:zinc-dependent metalloprotease [Psychrosphaera sp. G1-22]MDC2890518.1 zinc-dependent metalloprotease [Psychrosphaera sp. G1-22]
MSDPDARAMSSANPDGHLWDNGQDPAIELQRMLEIRKVALAQFGLNNLAANQPLSDLQEILVPIYLFHRFQVTAAAKLIGGVDYHYEIKGAKNLGISNVTSLRQRFALEQLMATLTFDNLTIPKTALTLIAPKAYGSYKNRESAPSKMGLVFDPITLASANAQHTLQAILDPARLNRIAFQHSQDQSNWSLTEYLQTIVDSTVKTLPADSSQAPVYQRLSALTVENLMTLLTNESSSIEIKAATLKVIKGMSNWLSVSIVEKTAHSDTTLYLLQHHIDWYLEHRKWQPLIKAPKLPPGSPI